MTLTPSQQETEVLAYYEREAQHEAVSWATRERKPCAGMSLRTFQAARARCVAKGLLVRVGSRYRPVEMAA